MLVSVVITTHNRDKLLRRAIESVLNQTHKEIECIVVDDASDTISDVKELYPIDYIYISRENSRGGNHARNVGLYKARGEYVAFLDDDDYWLPDKIEKQLELMQKKNCALVYCGISIEQIGQDRVEHKDLYPLTNYQGDVSKKILYNICTSTSCIFAKRRLVLETGGFDENLRFWQEYDLLIRLAQKGQFFFVNEPLVGYRVDTFDQHRLTNKYWEWLKAVEYIRNKYSDLYNKLNLLEKLQVKTLVWRDAVGRSSKAGLKWRSRWLRVLSVIGYLPYGLLHIKEVKQRIHKL